MAGSESSIEIHHTRIVLRSAIASRLLLVALIVLWRSLLNPYDTSAAINPSCLSSSSSNSPSVLFPRIASAIEDTVVWDGVYFVRIAQCGYEYEQSYAFFPLFPLSMALLSRTVFAVLIPVVGYRAVLALSGYVISNLAFVLAATCLYRLSVIILKDRETALRASILFCFNPASIFYSSIYTESLYSLSSIGGVYQLMSGANNLATLLFSLSGAARSNGVINAGYICYQTMHKVYDAVFCRRHFYLALQVLAAGTVRCLFIFFPFIAFQTYGYSNICLECVPDQMRPWCKARLPLPYNYIQSHYWGVGFLRYFQLKQLPNFLLASPILSLAICSIIHYIKLQPEIFFSPGFRGLAEHKNSASLGADTRAKGGYVLKEHSSRIQEEHHILRRRKPSIKGETSIRQDSSDSSRHLSVTVLPFVLHLGFMAATAFFVMHVQVATRFLSASPPLYWFASHLMGSPRIGKRWGYLIWAYCAAYILLGSLLFSNFYPFT
ncbi:GPI mannosyltransferase [Actinidia chinensis var. chinensis]|uniref:GPI mannosyltransferase 2 n=1 Tax=Actinidia chinensis var. chinensis TaxID=1590841 RepID=A0A2R6PFU6_ACTCC|nr:GPI mannosyltransferase [Actinidia chinensis var. chinensis]